MENLFYICEAGDVRAGVFGTLFECAKWVFSNEGINEEPDSVEPMEYAEMQVVDFNAKYGLLTVSEALPALLTMPEAVLLDAAPTDSVDAVQFWLSSADFDNATLRQMADILHSRVAGVRWRGVIHAVGQSPLTNDQYDQLQRQLG